MLPTSSTGVSAIGCGASGYAAPISRANSLLDQPHLVLLEVNFALTNLIKQPRAEDHEEPYAGGIIGAVVPAERTPAASDED